MSNQSVIAANNGTNLFDGATPLWQYAQPLADMGKLEIVNGDDTPRFEYQKTEHGIKVVNREDGHRFEYQAMAEPVETVDETEETEPAPDPNHLPLTQFLADFGSSLFDAVSEQNTPIYQGETVASDEKVLSELTRQLFPAQKTTVNAICRLLFDNHQPAGIINAEMGTGKTMMAIATAAVAYNRGYQRTLVLSPPHLVYKWRREIMQTIPNARVVILNGADTLSKLVLMKKTAHRLPETPEFYILGRVRMRMDYHWKPAYKTVYKAAVYEDEKTGEKHFHRRAEFCCPDCGSPIVDSENKPFVQEATLKGFLAYERRYCEAEIVKTVVKDGQVEKVKKVCNSPLWSLCRKDEKEQKGATDNLLETLCKLPSIGKRSATKLINQFGVDMLASMLEDSPLSFMNLQDENGDMVFSDKQALKLGRALGKIEFSQGRGGYQPTEFIKRYLPKNYFGLLVVDEGHEYKNYGTAQGQAMGTLARSCQKILCLTGTLMGGYADDLFYLLWRLNPNAMITDGFCYNKNRSLGTASMAFMEQHGVLKSITKSNGKEYDNGAFSSSRATRTTTRIARAPGFSPLGLMRFVLPMTVFLKLKDIGQDVLPPYDEHFHSVFLPAEMQMEYDKMQESLKDDMKAALAQGDNSLTGVVTNALLSWTECCFKPQQVVWRKNNKLLWSSPALFDDKTPTPKEEKMLEIVKENLAKGRKCLVYTVYSDTKDTTGRLKNLLAKQGIKASVLKASVKADEREDWVDNQIDAGCEVLICNPELVKTGLDLLQFPTIFFMQTGYNVYTVMQAARRSWRIGQTEPVEVHFAGYSGTAGEVCLELMGKKISVSQSTSGDMPENGLEILNQEEASIEVELAKRLIDKA